MAHMPVPAVEADIALEVLPVPTPTQTYAEDGDSAERAEPSASAPAPAPAPMPPQPASGIRNRLPEARSARVVTGTDELTATDPADIQGPAQDPAETPLLPTETIWGALRRILSIKQYAQRKREEQQAYDAEHGYDRFKYYSVDRHQRGCGQLASFLNSDESFAIFRRFGELSCRVLVHLQIELADLEQELLNLDNADAVDQTLRQRLWGISDFAGCDDKQKNLLSRIKEKLREYDEFLLYDTQVRALGTPQKRHFLGVYNWSWNKKPLWKGKDEFLRHADDFVSASRHSENGTRLSDLAEGYLDRNPGSFLKRFVQTKDEVRKSNDKYVDYYASARLKTFGKAVTVALSVCMLLVPVLLLFLVSMPRQLMAWTVVGFIVTFSIVLTLVTDAKVHEVLVGTAAYGAVLVTFLGNLSEGVVQ